MVREYVTNGQMGSIVYGHDTNENVAMYISLCPVSLLT